MGNIFILCFCVRDGLSLCYAILLCYPALREALPVIRRPSVRPQSDATTIIVIVIAIIVIVIADRNSNSNSTIVIVKASQRGSGKGLFRFLVLR